MLETLLFIVVFSLSVIGLSDLIHWIWLSIIRPKEKPKKTLLCYLCGEFADLQLRIVFEELLWYGKTYADDLVAIDYDIDESALSRCEEFAKDNNIRFISKVNNNNINISEL